MRPEVELALTGRIWEKERLDQAFGERVKVNRTRGTDGELNHDDRGITTTKR